MTLNHQDKHYAMAIKRIIILLVTFVLMPAAYSYASDLASETEITQFEQGLLFADEGNFEAAFNVWLALAKRGDLRAQYNIATMYAKGEGVVQDYTQSLQWHMRAGEQGFALSQYTVGIMYQQGIGGVLENPRRAARWLSFSAEQGLDLAQYSMGLIYFNGESVSQNDTEALRWWQLASSQGHAAAQSNLAMMYYDGRGGVPKDNIYAYMWWYIAASNGSDNAKKNLQIISQYMEYSDIERAESQANLCMSKQFNDC